MHSDNSRVEIGGESDCWWEVDPAAWLLMKGNHVETQKGRRGSTDVRKWSETGMKNQELINHGNEDRDGYHLSEPAKQRWMNGEVGRGGSLISLISLHLFWDFFFLFPNIDNNEFPRTSTPPPPFCFILTPKAAFVICVNSTFQKS